MLHGPDHAVRSRAPAHEHVAWVLGLCALRPRLGRVLGLCSGVRRWTMSLRARAAVTAAMMPIVGVALWATGGASSYLLPVLLFTALFIGWFFPPRLAWPLVGHVPGDLRQPAASTTPDAVDTSLPGARVRVLGRGRRPDDRDADPEAAPGPRRAAPAQLRRAGSADRRHQPARVRPRAGARRGDARSATRSCCSTSTTSRRSTISTATRPATSCCARSPQRRRAPSAGATAWRASAATSSRSSRRARERGRRRAGWCRRSPRRSRPPPMPEGIDASVSRSPGPQRRWTPSDGDEPAQPRRPAPAGAASARTKRSPFG